VNPTIPFADPIPLPAPPWLLSALLALSFLLHVVPMNLLLGGSIIGAVARFRGRRDPRAAAVADLVARMLPVLVAATVTPGVAALLFLQALYGRVFFSAAVLTAAPWLAVVPILVFAYYGTYLAGHRAGRPGGADGHEWLAPAIALSVVVVAFIFSNTMSLALRPETFAARFATDASGLHLDLDDPTLAPRFLHLLLGAVAVAGAGVALAGYRLRGRDAALAAWTIRHGVLACAAATATNLLPGFWWLAALRHDTLMLFMGRDLTATLVFAGGILSGLAALGHLIPAAFAPNPRSLLAGGAGSLVASVACMVVVRDVVRRADLSAAGLRTATWVEPQWGAIAVFAVLLLVAAALVWWMAAQLARRPTRSAGAPISSAS
jgi:hypothetical protein